MSHNKSKKDKWLTQLDSKWKSLSLVLKMSAPQKANPVLTNNQLTIESELLLLMIDLVAPEVILMLRSSLTITSQVILLMANKELLLPIMEVLLGRIKWLLPVLWMEMTNNTFKSLDNSKKSMNKQSRKFTTFIWKDFKQTRTYRLCIFYKKSLIINTFNKASMASLMLKLPFTLVYTLRKSLWIFNT